MGEVAAAKPSGWVLETARLAEGGRGRGDGKGRGFGANKDGHKERENW